MERVHDVLCIGKILPDSRDEIVSEVGGDDGDVLRMPIMILQPFDELLQGVPVLPFADEDDLPCRRIDDDRDVPVVLLRRGFVDPYVAEP